MRSFVCCFVVGCFVSVKSQILSKKESTKKKPCWWGQGEWKKSREYFFLLSSSSLRSTSPLIHRNSHLFKFSEIPFCFLSPRPWTNLSSWEGSLFKISSDSSLPQPGHQNSVCPSIKEAVVLYRQAGNQGVAGINFSLVSHASDF